MLSVIMLSVTYNPFILSDIMLDVVMLSVVAPGCIGTYSLNGAQGRLD